MFTLNYKVTTSCCDENGKLKLYSALQMMQDCSEMWINTEAGVKKYFEENGMAQLLVFRQVEVNRVPAYGEDLSVTTSVYGMKPMFGFRNTVIRDADGNPCYTTWSMGAFVDMSTGKLSRIPAEVLATMNLDPQVEMEYKDRRVFMPKENVVSREPYKVMRNDIDYNKHVNNANYVRIAQEFLPDGWDVKSMRVEFRIPAKMGDTLAIDTAEENGKFYVDIKVDGNSSTLVEFEK